MNRNDYILQVNFPKNKTDKMLIEIGVLRETHRELFETLSRNTSYANRIITGLYKLHQFGLLDDNTRDFILGYRFGCINHSCEAILDACDILQNEKQLTCETLKILKIHDDYPIVVAKSIIKLSKNGQLTQSFLNKMLNSGGRWLTHGFKALCEGNILTEENLDILVVHQNCPDYVGRAMKTLHLSDILTHDNLEKFLKIAKKYKKRNDFPRDTYAVQHSGPAPYGLVRSFELLSSIGILSQKYFNLLIDQINHAYPIADGLKVLKEASILNHSTETALFDSFSIGMDKKSLVLGYRNHSFSKSISILNEVNLLTPSRFKLLQANQNRAIPLARGIVALYKAGILTTWTQSLFEKHTKVSSYAADHMATALEILQSENLLIDDSFHRMCHMNNLAHSDLVAKVIKSLNKGKILNDDDLNWITQLPDIFFTRTYHGEKCASVDGIETLQESGLLDRFSLNIIINHPQSAEGFVSCIKTLKTCNILNDHYKDIIAKFISKSWPYTPIPSIGHISAVASNADIGTVAFHFGQLHDNLKTGKSFISLLNYACYEKDLQPAVNIMTKLDKLNLLPDDFEKIFNDGHPAYLIKRTNPKQLKYFSYCLDVLSRDGLFNSSNVKQLIQLSNDSEILYAGISQLSEASVLTQENFSTLISRPRFAIQISEGLKTLHEFGLLNDLSRAILIDSQVHEFRGLLNNFRRNRILIDEQGNEINVISRSLRLLFNTDPLDDEINRQWLVDNIQYLKPISLGITTLHYYNCLSQNTFDLLKRCPKFSDHLAECIGALVSADCFSSEAITNKLLLHPSSLKHLSISLKALSDNHILTQKNVNFLLQEQFKDCFPCVARAMVLLDNANALNEKNKTKLLKRPHHALLLAKEIGTEFNRRDAIDMQLFHLSKKCRVFGEARRDTTHAFSKMDPSVLSKIAFLSTEGNIDERTGIITGKTLLKKPTPNNRRLTLTLLFTGLLGASSLGYSGFITITSNDFFRSRPLSQPMLNYAIIIFAFSLIGLVLGVYIGMRLYNWLKTCNFKDRFLSMFSSKDHCYYPNFSEDIESSRENMALYI